MPVCGEIASFGIPAGVVFHPEGEGETVAEKYIQSLRRESFHVARFDRDGEQQERFIESSLLQGNPDFEEIEYAA